MESAPAVFAGTVFALFGAGLLGWTASRARHRAPVADGPRPALAATLAAVVSLVSLTLSVWCFARG